MAPPPKTKILAGRRQKIERPHLRHDNPHLRALWLLHDNCWNGEAGDFLIYHLCLSPYGEWNTMLVAEDARTASILDIPIWGVNPRVEEPAINLIRSYSYSAPYEDLRFKRP
jgi:hypothetical protein